MITVTVQTSVGTCEKVYYITETARAGVGEDIIAYGAGKIAKECYRRVTSDYVKSLNLGLSEREIGLIIRATWHGQAIRTRSMATIIAEKEASRWYNRLLRALHLRRR